MSASKRRIALDCPLLVLNGLYYASMELYLRMNGVWFVAKMQLSLQIYVLQYRIQGFTDLYTASSVYKGKKTTHF